jgi:hypothetical protein
MNFKVFFTQKAALNLEALENNSANQKTLKAVRKCLGYLEDNPKHPSLNTHEYTSLSRKFGTKIFAAYAENNTPQAYRVFWHYGPGKSETTIVAITPHP